MVKYVNKKFLATRINITQYLQIHNHVINVINIVIAHVNKIVLVMISH